MNGEINHKPADFKLVERAEMLRAIRGAQRAFLEHWLADGMEAGEGSDEQEKGSDGRLSGLVQGWGGRFADE